jgi:hypothetical protein
VGDFGDTTIATEEQLSEEKKYNLSPCRLQIIVTPGRMYLIDPDSVCREYFVGGAGLSGEVFDRRRIKQTKGVSCPPS